MRKRTPEKITISKSCTAILTIIGIHIGVIPEPEENMSRSRNKTSMKEMTQ